MKVETTGEVTVLGDRENPPEVPLPHRMGEGSGLLCPGVPGVRAAKIEAGLEHCRVYGLAYCVVKLREPTREELRAAL